MDSDKPKINKGLIITLSVIGTVLLIILSLYGYISSLQQQGVAREEQLTHQYSGIKSDLDTFLTRTRELAGVTTAQSAAFDKIMLDAVSGRYDNNSSAKPGSGQLFSAIAEAYPNLDSINSSFSRIQDSISSGRATFNNDQQKLQDLLRSYDQWRKSGLVQPWIVSHVLGVPSDNLTVNNGNGILTGQTAYNAMNKVIISSTTANAYSTGQLQAQNFFGQ